MRRERASEQEGARALPSDTEAKAVARMLPRVSPQKLNLLAQLIRGKKVAAALADLEFSRKRIARDVRKVPGISQSPTPRTITTSTSTTSSWCEAHVGKALVLKRSHAAARGRAGKIFKPFSNLTIVVRRGRGAGLGPGREIWVRRSIRSRLRLGINRTWDSRWFAGKTELRVAAARGHEDPRGADGRSSSRRRCRRS